MPKLAANLTMLFNEVGFLDRFGEAARAGFKGVEFLFPYAFEAARIAERLEANRLVDACIDDEHVHAALAQTLAQERVLDAFRVERAQEDDGHACSASGSTPRKRR